MEFRIFQKLKCHCSHRKLGCLAVFGGILVQMTLGGVYSYGNMAPYLLTYMRNNTEPYNAIGAGNMIWIFGFTVFGIGASMSFGGFVEPRFGTRLTILFGCWTMSLGVLLTNWTIKIHLALVVFTYGLLVGLGVGFAYGVNLSIPSKWFPNSKGLAIGIVVAGFGLGTITLDITQLYFINRNITTIKPKSVSKVPESFLVFAAIYASIQLMGCLMISRPDEKESPSAQDIEPRILFGNVYLNENESDSEINLKPHQLLWERDFWILWITFSLNSVVSVMILCNYKIYGITLNISDKYLTFISISGELANVCGRILWGYLNDRIAYKVLMLIMSLCMSLMIGTFYICSKVGEITNHNDPYRTSMYSAWVVFLFFLQSAIFTLYPTICCKTFGSWHFSGNYGILFTGYSFAGILTSVLSSNLIDDDKSPKPFLAPFLVCSGLSLLSAGITTFYRGKSLIYQRESL